MDEEQQIIDFICKNASYPLWDGKFRIKYRRVLLIGIPYYWEDPKPLEFSNIPEVFKKFLIKHKLNKFTSILCNVYDDKKGRISRHRDTIDNLINGETVSISFAMYKEDRGKNLATMNFSYGYKNITNAESIELKHGKLIKFNIIDDYYKWKYHEVKNTNYPRVNITLRNLK